MLLPYSSSCPLSRPRSGSLSCHSWSLVTLPPSLPCTVFWSHAQFLVVCFMLFIHPGPSSRFDFFSCCPLCLFAWPDPAHLLSISSVITFFRRHSADHPTMSSMSSVHVLSHWYPGPTPTIAVGATWYYPWSCHPQPIQLLLEDSN